MPTRTLVLNVNGARHEVQSSTTATLAEVLREGLGLTGTKLMCNEGECGACTVLINSRPVLSCMTLAADAENKKIMTIEGMADLQTGALHPIQQAFVDRSGMQCGVCTPGMILTAKALLDDNPSPTEDDVRNALSGNLCRCGNYRRITESVLLAARRMKEGGKR
ncbi:MAG: (2Fe-2S)-binding protein [Dehalococcoidia bacterium]|nr:(2Fe-2S)-binding protein [Dehalococcoidia bacterium]